MQDFNKLQNLPPYVFEIIGQYKMAAIKQGEDIIDFGMGNPDQPPAAHIINTLIEATKTAESHRYSASKGIPALREAVCRWYQRRFNVWLDPETEAVATMGSKEGLAHLALITLEKGDTVLVPSPCYPIHLYGNILAGANVIQIPFLEGEDFIANLQNAIRNASPRPKMLILNFPNNPTTECVDLAFFEKIIAIAKENNIWVVHDLAYGEIAFDGYQAPSILQVPGAKEIAAEFYTLSKSYDMPGWRVGFMCGNAKLVYALTRIKSYLDYGMFAPIQLAAVAALDGPQDNLQEIIQRYQHRRDLLCEGLNTIGWSVKKPKATMFVWAKIPKPFHTLGSIEFAKLLIAEAKVAVSPGAGFGDYGNDYVRFSLIENDQRIMQGLAGIGKMMLHEELKTPARGELVG